MRVAIMTAFVVLTALGSAPAMAGVTLNGVTLNGITLNELKWNGLGFNELKWNGLRLQDQASVPDASLKVTGIELAE